MKNSKGLNHEESRYTYVIIRKGKRPESTVLESTELADNYISEAYNWSRLILPPLKHGEHVLLDCCSKNGK